MNPGDWHQAALKLLHLSGAFLLTAIIGWNRERESHNVGIRAFPIVGISSCAYLMVTMDPSHFDQASTSRVLQGLITGIGFVGGGAIVKEGVTAHGTATAAAVWCAGAIGTAVALDHWSTAIILTGLTMLALRGLTPLKSKLDKEERQIGRDS
jgi:putative Mg2+ transporter-C (MgtC) family protein